MAIKIRKKVESQEVPVESTINNEAEQVDENEQRLERSIVIPDKSMDDRFVRTSGSLLGWVLDHGRLIALVVGVIILAIIVTAVVMRNKESNVVEKSSILNPVFITNRAPTKEIADAVKARNEADLKQQGIAADTSEVLSFGYTVPNDNVRKQVIYDHLDKSMPSFEDSAIAVPAQLLRAGFAVQLDKLGEAEKSYNAALSVKDDDVKLFALMGQASVLVNQGKIDEAIAVYESIATLSGSFYASFANLNIAQLYELKNDTAKAVESYTKVATQYNRPADVQVATERLKILSPEWEKLIQAPLPVQPQPAI